MNLFKPGDSPADNTHLQLAQSRKYDSRIICTIAEIEPGIYALYQHATPLYIGNDWAELLAYYKARPVYTPKPRPARVETRKTSGKISAAERAANTARLLAAMRKAQP